MNVFAHMDGLHALIGLLVGLLVGLTGVGGGSLMTPLLVLLFHVAPQTAVGTDLLYAAITKMTGSAVHGQRDTVEWRIVGRLALGSVPAAFFTLGGLAWLGHPVQQVQHVIIILLAVLLALTSLTALFQSKLMAYAKLRDPGTSEGRVLVSTIVLGAVIGLMVSISSVGAGAIGVTALLMLYPRLSVVRVVGTDIAHAVPLALIAGAGHWFIGDVNLGLLGNLLIGSIPGVIIGSLLSTRAPDGVLRPLLAVVLAISSWQLFLKAFLHGG